MQTTYDIAETARTATTARERYAIVDRLARKGCAIEGLTNNRWSYMRALAPMVPAVKASRARHCSDGLTSPLAMRVKVYRIMAKNGHDVREAIRNALG